MSSMIRRFACGLAVLSWLTLSTELRLGSQEIPASKGGDLVASIIVEAASRVFHEVGIPHGESNLIARELERRWSTIGTQSRKGELKHSENSSIVIVSRAEGAEPCYRVSQLGDTSILHIELSAVDASDVLYSVVLNRMVSKEDAEITGFEVCRSKTGILTTADVKISTAKERRVGDEKKGLEGNND